MFQKAIDLQNAGALNEAESIYLKLLQVMPENSDVWNLLGLIAQSKGDTFKAVDCFLSAVKYAPQPFFAHYFNLGLAYKSLNRYTESLEALRYAVKLAPETKEIWNYLGLTQANAGLHEEAVKSFCKAVELDYNYYEAKANLCFYTKDIETLLNVADEVENDFWSNFKAAECVADTERKEHYLKRAIKAAPEREDGLLALADLYRQKGDFNNSLTFYHKVLNLNDKDVSALLGTADIYLAQKNFDKAEKYYLKSFTQTRELAGAYVNYGILLYQTGRISEALEAYRKAATLEPEKPEISYNLALILKETGDLEEALGLLFNAHLKVPENQLFIINIAETLSLLFRENAELALKIAENWQKQEPNNIFSKRVFAGMSGIIPEEADKTYAERLFDAFATTYDDTIAKLEPKIINKFKELNSHFQGRVLDLGCGTGLAAVALKNDKTTFDGVDISAQMLAVAQQKGLYDNLYQQDIMEFLEKHSPSRYDVVLAFDVFCYLGDLDDVLRALKGVEVWFSVESADEERGENYYLTPEGRYKHKESYVRHILTKSGFQKIDAYPLVLRKERDEDVRGILFKAR